MNTDRKEFDDYVEKIKQEFPKFQIIPKEESPLMKFIYNITLMRFWNKQFMSRFITVMFGKVYMPKQYIGSHASIDILRHELVHLRDMKKYPVLFELTYILFPLPTVFTLRAFWEYRGYCESIRAINDRYGYVPVKTIEFFVEQFTGPSYLWMCPFPKFVRGKFLEFANKNNIKVI